MIGEVIFALVSVVLLVAAMLIRPAAARCPGDWYTADGIKPSGEFGCSAPPRGLEGSDNGNDVQPDAYGVKSRIYCTGGAVPIVVDSRTVGCTR